MFGNISEKLKEGIDKGSKVLNEKLKEVDLDAIKENSTNYYENLKGLSFEEWMKKVSPNEVIDKLEEIGFKIEEVGIFILPPFIKINIDMKNSNIDKNKYKVLESSNDLNFITKNILLQITVINNLQDKVNLNNRELSNIEIEIGFGKPTIQMIYK